MSNRIPRRSNETLGVLPVQIFETTAMPIEPDVVFEIPRSRPMRQLEISGPAPGIVPDLPSSGDANETFGLTLLEVFELTAIPVSPETVIETPRGRPVRQLEILEPSTVSATELPGGTHSADQTT